MWARKDLPQMRDVECVQQTRLTVLSPFEFVHTFFIEVIDRVIERFRLLSDTKHARFVDTIPYIAHDCDMTDWAR